MMATVVTTEKTVFTFIWRIDNFSHYLMREEELLTSPKFEVESLKSTLWNLQVNLKKERVAIYLFRGTRGPNKILVRYELSFLTEDNSPPVTVYSETRNVKQLTQCGIGNYPTHEEVFVTKQSVFLPQDTLTVRCRLWNPEESVVEPQHCLVRTQMQVEQRSFVWSIQDFSNLQLNEVRKTKVRCPLKTQLFTVEFFLHGAILQEANVNVKVAKSATSEKFTMCKVSLLDRLYKPVRFEQDTNMSGSGKQKWNFPKFFTRHELMERKNDYLPEDTLLLNFEFFTSCDSISAGRGAKIRNHSGVAEQDKEVAKQDIDVSKNDIDVGNYSTELAAKPSNAAAPMSLLQHDLLNLYENQTLCDFVLRTSDTTFPVHKVILSARSSIFKDLFASDKNETAILDMPDVDTDTLRKMLLFMYTNTVPDIDWESAEKLYVLAGKYDINILRELCSFYLKSNVEASNVLDILAFSEDYSDDELKTAVYKFLFQHANEIFSSQKWQIFMGQHLQLAAETMRAIFSMKK